MKSLLTMLLMLISAICFCQDKMGFGNDTEGADSAGYGTVTTWVKTSEGILICGEMYDTVRIGNQTWLARNLHCSDGGAGIYSYNNSVDSSNIYGYLYNYAAAVRMDGLISGWHLPTRDEYLALRTYIGGTSYGYKLKIAGTRYWENESTITPNSTKFSALGTGYRDSGGVSYLIRNRILFWAYKTTTVQYYARLYYSVGSFSFDVVNTTDVNQGFSIRLIKD